uniref:DUF6824 domain-containing protein n=1 Tax=Entomoneis paludosa TaxID=265537 RepID=A0A7S2YTG8_9STRA|mmetsp:Transcript_9477/g.19698  ORF Transcript_9477/g.19698 Transcript_9477/m.19698 type:complete len:330 (+) Transcript_9477:174-1163(+)|eukprot:CAMPEP_0172454014 /NCGR_PEP_ID=MMETSP1065-20121228/11127_1 /TAXON_ID=265537 /ORGANISM="Amphiprora paludosa, Strain CCMP125" /LENGTH=329 /DNA_ID=CAMNT_0013206271 /DNA_START=170 /DNA_END=1159 /DNA_ORIENTATION=+
MAPNTRGNPKASSAAYDYHHHHDDPHNRHPHVVSHETYGSAYGNNGSTTASTSSEYSKLDDEMKPVPSTGAVERDMPTLKRKLEDVDGAAAEGQSEAEQKIEQQVGLKLLFAASLLQSKQAQEGSDPTVSTSSLSSTQTPAPSPEISSTMGMVASSDPSAAVPTTPRLPPSTQNPPQDPASPSTEDMAESTVSQVVHQPSELDVLCGRGGLINKHPGNIVYRRVVDHNKKLYKEVPKRHRILVSQSIVQTIQTHGGRFLQQSGVPQDAVTNLQHGGKWMTVPFRRAVQKTSQALREPSQSEGESGGVRQEEDDEEVGQEEAQGGMSQFV